MSCKLWVATHLHPFCCVIAALRLLLGQMSELASATWCVQAFNSMASLIWCSNGNHTHTHTHKPNLCAKRTQICVLNINSIKQKYCWRMQFFVHQQLPKHTHTHSCTATSYIVALVLVHVYLVVFANSWCIKKPRLTHITLVANTKWKVRCLYSCIYRRPHSCILCLEWRGQHRGNSTHKHNFTLSILYIYIY